MSLGMDFPASKRSCKQLAFPLNWRPRARLEGYRTNVQLFARLAALVVAQEPLAKRQ
jgi:hypothetical protein